MSDLVELTAAQAEAVAAIDAAVAEIREAFGSFRAAADACDRAGVPQQIIMGKAAEFQQAVLEAMSA